MPVVYGDYETPYTLVQYWVAEFMCGRIILEDEPRPDMLVEATSEAPRELLVKDRRMKVSEIARY